MAEETKEKKYQVPTCAEFNENTEEMKRHLAVLREKKGAATTLSGFSSRKCAFLPFISSTPLLFPVYPLPYC